ncbi:MFS transporter [Solitalea longa]|uniref:MFS transporter n=1 Tax=Solitalea longa TaxID=2079460 RepID=A0A2S4ZXC4_9SPHI|nr:MFS transporter [Solitalea longa]POY35014.1 MFS transporter [Solitalea longa]
MSSFLFSASFNMLIPELPSYLTSLGGAEYKGLIIALFTLTAGISRPFSGKLTDTIGRVPVMAIGSLVCFFCGFLYPVLTTVAGFLLLRLFHGFSTGFKPTATAAYVADLIPVKRWGEAMGIHGLFFSTGMAIGPAIGSWITSHFSINVLFYCSSVFALLSIAILMNMKETLRDKQRFHPSHLKINRKDIIDTRALPAAIITFLSYISYGAILTVVSDWSLHLGVTNKGLFYMVFTIASLLIRFLAGKVSDRHGRIIVLKVSLSLLIMALLAIGFAKSAVGLLAASSLYGVSTGMLSPTVSAWTVDLGHPEQRGKAMATMYIALEAGIGLGALLAGWLFIHDLKMIPITLYICAGITSLALIYMQINFPKNKQTRQSY